MDTDKDRDTNTDMGTDTDTKMDMNIDIDTWYSLTDIIHGNWHIFNSTISRIFDTIFK
jgi:hypothetical protein